MRERLTDQMPATSFDGEVGSAFLTHEQSVALMPRMIELNSIIRGVREHLSIDRVMALRLARDFSPIMKRHFGVDKFPGFTFEPGIDDDTETLTDQVARTNESIVSS